MKKMFLVFIILFGFVFFVSSASARVTETNLLDRPLMNVSNCYNLTVHYNLVEGNSTPISFKDCTDIGNKNFFCKCNNLENTNYTLVMRTDKTMIRDAREYDISVSGFVYSFFDDKVSFTVLDWGDYTEITGGKNRNKLGEDGEQSCPKCNNDAIIEYRDVPVEVIRYVNNTVEVVKEVNVSVFVENTSKFLELNESNNNLSKQVVDLDRKVRNRNLFLQVILVLFLAASSFIVYKMFLEKRGDED